MTPARHRDTPAGPRTPLPAPGGRDPVAGRLAAAVRAVDAPDVVFAYSRHGRRTVISGGTRPPAPGGREHLRYEIGSASKVFTGLLLAHQILRHAVDPAAPAAALFTPTGLTDAALTDADPAGFDLLGDGPAFSGLGGACGGADSGTGASAGAGVGAGMSAVTLTHLATHTSGLPRLPCGFYPQALPRWSTQPYAGYGTGRLVGAFLRSRPAHRPGTHWRYSNFGVSVLGHALGAAAGTSWEDLLTRQVLRPLSLTGTWLHPQEQHTPRPDGQDGQGGAGDAVGHRADGVRAVPGLRAGGFGPAGAVRATPADLLTFLEAHAQPDGSPLEAALTAVRHPVLRRGGRHREEEHTLTWFRHQGAAGPFCFHAGATSGQQAFLGFQPATGTALAAVCTRRFRRGDTLVSGAYALLAAQH